MSRSFDAVDDVINCGSSNLSANMNSISVVVWMNPNTAGEANAGRIITKNIGNSDNNGWNFQLRGVSGSDSAGLRFFVDYLNANLTVSTTAGLWLTKRWAHVGFTWPGSNSANTVNIYVSGTAATEYSTLGSGSGSRVSDTIRNINIGNRGDTTSTFNGKLAHLHLYNTVLNEGEIKQLMKFPGSITNKLVGYWPLIGTSSTEPDLSGNGHNGVVTGAINSIDEPPINGMFTIPRPELMRSF